LVPFFCRPFLDNGCSKPFNHRLVLLGFRELGQPELSALRRIQVYDLGDELFHVSQAERDWVLLLPAAKSLDAFHKYGIAADGRRCPWLFLLSFVPMANFLPQPLHPLPDCLPGRVVQPHQQVGPAPYDVSHFPVVAIYDPDLAAQGLQSG
jgi:hypothetical protein